VRMTRAHSSPEGVVPVIMQIALTLDLSPNNLFFPSPPSPPPPMEVNFMDIDVPDDFYFIAPNIESDFDQGSSLGEVSLPSSSTKMEEDMSPTYDDIDMEDALQTERESESEEDDPIEEPMLSSSESEDKNMIKGPMPSSPLEIGGGDD